MSSAVVAAFVIVACLLAIGAGLAKLLRPSGAVVAMHDVGLPSNRLVVRTISLGECALGVVVLATAAVLPRLALALLYASFAGFAALSLRAGVTTPCGCFGVGGAPPGGRHLGVAAALALVLVASVVTESGRLLLPASGLEKVIVLLVGGCSAGLAALVMTRTSPRHAQVGPT
jgi:hypothetical protein